MYYVSTGPLIFGASVREKISCLGREQVNVTATLIHQRSFAPSACTRDFESGFAECTVDTRARVTGIACARECVNRARVAKQERVSQKELVRERQSSQTRVYFCVCRRDFPYPEPGSWAQGCSQQTRPATHWATLQHTATHYNTLERALAAAPPGRALQQTATHQVRGQPHVPTQTT